MPYHHSQIKHNRTVCASYLFQYGNNLSHWGRVTHICASKLNFIGSDNGLAPDRRQAIIWTYAGMLWIRTLGTIFTEILSEIHTFSFKKMYLKMSSVKWLQFCFGLKVSVAPCTRALYAVYMIKVIEILMKWHINAANYKLGSDAMRPIL